MDALSTTLLVSEVCELLLQASEKKQAEEGHLEERNVRTVGTLTGLSVEPREGTLEQGGMVITLDMHLLPLSRGTEPDRTYRIGTMYNVVGTLRLRDGRLEARVMERVSDVDETLYERALQLRRQHLEREQPGS